MRIEREALIDCPEIDTTIIAFGEPQSNVKVYRLSDTPPTIGEAVYSSGYIADQMPVDGARWRTNCLVVESCDLREAIADQEGFVSSVRMPTVNASDIKLNNVKGVETSFAGAVGMSGGSLIRRSTGAVIGLMSIGLPPDTSEKRTLVAISVE